MNQAIIDRSSDLRWYQGQLCIDQLINRNSKGDQVQIPAEYIQMKIPGLSAGSYINQYSYDHNEILGYSNEKVKSDASFLIDDNGISATQHTYDIIYSNVPNLNLDWALTPDKGTISNKTMSGQGVVGGSNAFGCASSYKVLGDTLYFVSILESFNNGNSMTRLNGDELIFVFKKEIDNLYKPWKVSAYYLEQPYKNLGETETFRLKICDIIIGDNSSLNIMLGRYGYKMYKIEINQTHNITVNKEVTFGSSIIEDYSYLTKLDNQYWFFEARNDSYGYLHCYDQGGNKLENNSLSISKPTNSGFSYSGPINLGDKGTYIKLYNTICIYDTNKYEFQKRDLKDKNGNSIIPYTLTPKGMVYGYVNRNGVKRPIQYNLMAAENENIQTPNSVDFNNYIAIGKWNGQNLYKTGDKSSPIYYSSGLLNLQENYSVIFSKGSSMTLKELKAEPSIILSEDNSGNLILTNAGDFSYFFETQQNDKKRVPIIPQFQSNTTNRMLQSFTFVMLANAEGNTEGEGNS